jgi:hypothetical protein
VKTSNLTSAIETKKNSVALSPQVNYTDLAAATCRRNLVPTFVDRRVSRGQRGGSPTVTSAITLENPNFALKLRLVYAVRKITGINNCFDVLYAINRGIYELCR